MFRGRKSAGAAKKAGTSIHNNSKSSSSVIPQSPPLASVFCPPTSEQSNRTVSLYHNNWPDTESICVTADIFELVTCEAAIKHQFVPIERKDNDLFIAVTQTFDESILPSISMELGCNLIPRKISETELSRALNSYSRSYFSQNILSSIVNEDADLDANHSHLEGTLEETPVVKLMNYLLLQAVRLNASDIHLEPQKDNVRIRFRIDGSLVDLMTLPAGISPSLISRIKIMSNLDISERRQPQDGRMRAVISGEEIHFRVSTIPAVHGEKAVLRILNRLHEWMSIERLGLEEYNRELFARLLQSSRGMILIAGPTGSGKTSTMYAMLDYLNQPERNIITLEDPIECIIPGITQVQINTRTGFTFARGLRSVLRQDPDIIMVGEIRDIETAELAVRSALTGHLVLSTIHTGSACGAVTRLVDMGIEPYLISAALSGVVSQRLVRTICPECKAQNTPDFERMPVTHDSKAKALSYFKGAGCESCMNTGYHGRLALQEILFINKEIGVMISTGAMECELERKAVADGMIMLREDGLCKAQQGITTIEEVWKETFV